MAKVRCANRSCDKRATVRAGVWVIQNSAISPVVPRDYCDEHLAEAKANPELSVSREGEPDDEKPPVTEEGVIADALRLLIRDREFLDPMKGGTASMYTTPQDADRYKEEIAIAERLLESSP